MFPSGCPLSRSGAISWFPCILSILAGMAHAQSCVQPLCVNSVIDSAAAPAPGTLRYAVLNAPTGGTITFHPALSGQTITLDTSSPNNHLVVSRNLTIQGPGANLLTISGGNGTRILFIAAGTVTISGLTLANGLARGGNGGSGVSGGGGAAGMGGAIFVNGGYLTLRNVVLSGNTARGGSGGPSATQATTGGGGGGFAGDGGPGGNPAAGAGGSGGDLGNAGVGGVGGAYLVNTYGVSDGGSGGFGGGGGGGGVDVVSVDGDTSQSDGFGGGSLFGGGGGGGYPRGGVAGFGGGAGIGANPGGGGGGGGAGFGGAIFAAAGSIVISNSTFTGNTSTGGAGASVATGGQAKGGALFVCAQAVCGYGHQAGVILTNATFQGNTAANAGAAATCPGRDDADVCGILTFSAPTHFSVAPPPGIQTFYTGVPGAITVTALDDNNLTVFPYAGTVHFTSTDGLATLPPDSTLVQGMGSFFATMATPGSQTITASDTVSASITGTSSPINVASNLSSASLAASPGAGSGLAQAFSFTFSDPAGYQDLDVVNVLINSTLDGRNACFLAYSRPLNVLYLVDDPGTALSAGLALNSSGSAGNSQCTVAGAGSSATGSGTVLTLTLNLTFSGTFAGNQIVFMAARGIIHGSSGWQAMGAWTVPGIAPSSPAVTGLSPARTIQTATTTPVTPGSRFTATFTFTVPTGWLNQNSTVAGIVDVLVNNFLDGRQACYIAYIYNFGHLYMVNDAGNALLPDVLADGVSTVSNSQCSVAASGTGSGNALTLTLNIAFFVPFRGNRVVYAAARSNGGNQNSGWQAIGTWTVQ